MSTTASAFFLCLAQGTAASGTDAPPSPSLRFEQEILAFEEADRKAPPPEDAVLFTGSSSIRGWRTLAEDFPEHRVLNRGFGGSHIADCIYFADRIVLPYRPQMIVFYAGENDMNYGRSPAEVEAAFRRFVEIVHAGLPETEIAYVSMKPSPSRRHLIDAKREGNRRIREFTEEDPRLSFIDVFEAMLDEAGEPRSELFVADQLHMNEKGYRLWTDIIRPHMP